MTHKRNVDGLRKSAQLRHQQVLQRAEEGIRRLALALEEEPGPRPAPTNDGGAIAR